MRKSTTINIDEKVLEELRRIKKKEGVPISRSLELAFKRVHGENE